MLTLSSKTRGSFLQGSQWLTLSLFVITLLVLASPADAQDQATFIDKWIKVFDGSANLGLTLQKARLAKDLPAALENLPAKLRGSEIEVSRVTPGSQVRLGAKMVPVEGQLWWEHFEGAKQRPFVDVIEFKDEASAKRVYDLRWPYFGGDDHTHRLYVTLDAQNGLDAVGVIVLRGCYLFNFGMGIPFRVRMNFQQNGTPEELKYIADTSDWLPRVMGAVARDVIDPSYVTWIPPANLTDEDRKIQRMAAFARLWSEVKYNFVFLDRRPDLDWDSMLEVYLPRVAAARTQEEYTRVLEEAIALLKDGHTKVVPYTSQDLLGLNLEPIKGRPVVTDVADTPEMRSTGVTPGMELTAVNGVPVDQVLKEKIYPYVAASTSQGRDDRACWQLLIGETGSKLSATFSDLEGRTRTVELSYDLMSDHPTAAKRWQKLPLEFRSLANGITYVALNNFGNDEVPKQFDAHFNDILNSKGLILDVRENGGGSDYNGYAIIARLIDKPITQALKALSRVYKPYYRSTGKPEEWDVVYGGPIQPGGEKPFLGPVVVLIGSRTFSAAEDFLVPLKATKRATLIGTPTGGSTGNPLRVKLYKADLWICTSWGRFPDDTEFVGVGIQPDILVQQTRRDVAEGRDPALERAVALLTGGK